MAINDKTKKQLIELAGKLSKKNSELEKEKNKFIKLEETLRKYKDSLDMAQEITHIGNWEWDIQADRITWSDELYRIYDLEHKKNQITYNVLMERIHPDDREYHDKHTDGWLKNLGGDPFEYRIIRSDGSIRYIYGPGKVFCDDTGKPVKMFGIVRDITERKETENVLKSSEEKFKVLADKSPNMIFINKKGRVVYVNERCVAKMGYTREEYYSENFNFMDLIAPESIDLINENYSRHMRGEEIPSYEYKIIKKSGEILFAIISTALIDFENEKAILGIVTDITKRKKDEDKIRKTRDELELRVRERTLELQEKNIALKVLLKQRAEDKNDMEQNILSNIKSLIQPYVTKLKRNNSNLEDISYLNIIESNLEEIISPFSQKLSSNYMRLTSKEIQIANLIKEGKKDKEIMEIMNIAFDTVKSHRRNIRKKLGIRGTGTNLRNKLFSM